MGQSNVRNRRPAQNGRKFAYNQMLGAFALQWPHREEILSEIASIMNFAVAVGTLALGMIPLAANPQECQGKMEIAVGGISGFADLANPENTRLLRSSACRVRLYLHRYAWGITPPDTQQEILALFKPTENPVVEIEMHPDPGAYFRTEFSKLFLAAGVVSNEAHVNGFDVNHPISQWMQFVDAGRKVGLSTLSPIVSPNNGEYLKDPFASRVWDNARAAANYGGGLTLDPPSDFFFAQGHAYQEFAVDEIRWARANHLRSAVIISPGQSGDAFLALTQKLVQVLQAENAVPTEYIVENYEPFPPPAYANDVGSELGGNTVSGVALWLAQHAEAVSK